MSTNISMPKKLVSKQSILPCANQQRDQATSHTMTQSTSGSVGHSPGSSRSVSTSTNLAFFDVFLRLRPPSIAKANRVPFLTVLNNSSVSPLDQTANGSHVRPSTCVVLTPPTTNTTSVGSVVGGINANSAVSVATANPPANSPPTVGSAPTTAPSTVNASSTSVATGSLKLSYAKSVAPSTSITTTATPTFTTTTTTLASSAEQFAFTQVFDETASQIDVLRGSGVDTLVARVLNSKFPVSSPQVTSANLHADDTPPSGSVNSREASDAKYENFPAPASSTWNPAPFHALLTTLGVTGSGKTFTLMGSRTQRGLVHLILEIFFRSINESGGSLAGQRLVSSSPTLVNANSMHATCESHITSTGDKTVRLINWSCENEKQAHISKLINSLGHSDASDARYCCASDRAMHGNNNVNMTGSNKAGADSSSNSTSTAFTPACQSMLAPPVLPKDLTFSVNPNFEYAIVLSMYQVYNDRIYDMLAPGAGVPNLARNGTLSTTAPSTKDQSKEQSFYGDASHVSMTLVESGLSHRNGFGGTAVHGNSTTSKVVRGPMSAQISMSKHTHVNGPLTATSANACRAPSRNSNLSLNGECHNAPLSRPTHGTGKATTTTTTTTTTTSSSTSTTGVTTRRAAAAAAAAVSATCGTGTTSSCTSSNGANAGSKGMTSGGVQGYTRPRPILFKATERSAPMKLVTGLQKVVCQTYEEAVHVLGTGLRARPIAGTSVNAVSSRSHAFICIEIRRRLKDGYSDDNGNNWSHDANCEKDDRFSRNRYKERDDGWKSNSITIVDLAGSERARNAQTTGATLAEAGKINESLMFLGQCMQLQLQQSRHTGAAGVGTSETNGGSMTLASSLRQCKLTELLFMNYFSDPTDSGNKETEGSGCWRLPRAVMIVTVDRYGGEVSATAQILRYSTLAREVKMIERVNTVSMPTTSSTMVLMLKNELRRAKSRIRELEAEVRSLRQSCGGGGIKRIGESKSSGSPDKGNVKCGRSDMGRQSKRRKSLNITESEDEEDTRIQAVRDELVAEMERRVMEERARWATAWAEASVRFDNRVDRKVDLAARAERQGLLNNGYINVNAKPDGTWTPKLCDGGVFDDSDVDPDNPNYDTSEDALPDRLTSLANSRKSSSNESYTTHPGPNASAPPSPTANSHFHEPNASPSPSPGPSSRTDVMPRSLSSDESIVPQASKPSSVRRQRVLARARWKYDSVSSPPPPS